MMPPSSVDPSPEDNFSIWQFMTVSWLNPLIRLGHDRQLEDSDVWQLPAAFQHEGLHYRFRELKGTVIRRLIKANYIDIIILTVLGIFELVLRYASPVLLQLLLSTMEDPGASTKDAIVIAAVAMVVSLFAAQSGVFSLWYGRRCYERSRGEMITMLYEKTLNRQMGFAEEVDVDKRADLPEIKLPWWKRFPFRSEKATSTKPPRKAPASMGKILNLMRNDVYEVAQRFWEVQGLVQKPLSVVFSITLVVRLLGWPSMLAVLGLLVAQALVVVIARIRVHFEKKRRIKTDRRLQYVSQFVELIRHLRWYGWQHAWLSRVMEARSAELYARIVTESWGILIGFINALGLDLTPVVAFFAYTVIAGKVLRVDIVFPAMQLFQMMTMSLRDLPDLVTVVINAYVAVGRIEDYMAEPDKQEMTTEALLSDLVSFNDCSFAWPGVSATVLRNLTLSSSKGLTVVFGEVGSGKSALLQALLGELNMLQGELLRPNEQIAYCAQSPWLQSMSIRENILFGEPLDERRYWNVIAACMLKQDLEGFKDRDLSQIGENGIGLSGGQRARIALARALYSRAKILLLDDPLASLDQQTAEAVVRNCFAHSKESYRTFILVTHRTDLVFPVADQLICVTDGTASVVDVEFITRTLSIDSGALPDARKERSASYSESSKVPEISEPDDFIEDEHRAHGGVKASIYWQFIKAGTLRWWACLIVVLITYRVTVLAQLWFLKTWGEAYNQRPSLTLLLQEAHISRWDLSIPFFDRLPPPDDNIKPWLLVLLLLAVFLSFTFILFRVVMVILIYTTGKSMFAEIMDRVAGANFRFYDVTPVGRLMNRMTSDIGVVDGNISMQLQDVAWRSIGWISAIVVIGSITPLFLAFAILLTVIFIMIFLRFIPTSQSLRRLEMVSLTPLMSNFGTLLQGLTTVRAFRAQKQFQDRVIRVVDTFQKMDHFYWSLQAWLMYRYDSLSAISTFLITVMALATNVSAGLTAFVLLSANRLVSSTHGLCKQYGQLQMEFVSVERVIELFNLDQEPKGDISPPAWWPAFNGDVVFDNVTIRYAPHLAPALKGVSFTLKGGSKTAIIGRTGSGKSTLALALLAAVVPEDGSILIDSIDLTKVDKQLLRTRITFLAQDPVLFPGLMQYNLDPMEEHTDEECMSVLDRVCGRQGWNLQTTIEAGGSNLSQGQRQLVGLARAVLRKSAIIILDEATAAIDIDTASQIQEVLQEEMKQSTVVTIAHRVEAVKHADYRIVLGDGKIVEQGPVG